VNRVDDPHKFLGDPDPGFENFSDADPDPGCEKFGDLDPGLHFHPLLVFIYVKKVKKRTLDLDQNADSDPDLDPGAQENADYDPDTGTPKMVVSDPDPCVSVLK